MTPSLVEFLKQKNIVSDEIINNYINEKKTTSLWNSIEIPEESESKVLN